MPVGLALLQEPALAEPLEDPGVGLLLRQPGQLAGLVVHAAVGPDHHRLRQSVVSADLEVERVVAGRHLQRARPELRVDALVGDHRHRALDERHEHLPADRVAASARRPGCTATATSPRIVAGRAVAIVTPPADPSANG